jgi:hypothetical protein
VTVLSEPSERTEEPRPAHVRHQPAQPALATATDLLWLLNDPANYNLLVIERRWPARRFRTWLTNTMQTQLLPPPAADRRTVAR